MTPSKLPKWLQSLFTVPPTKRHSVPLSPPQTPPSLAPWLDIDAVFNILANADSRNTEAYFQLCGEVIGSDSHIQSELGKRKLALLRHKPNPQPASESPEDQTAADFLTAQIRACPDFLIACSHLLDSTLYPVSLIEKVYTPTPAGFALHRLIPVPYELYDFSQTGHLRIFDTSIDGFKLSTSHLCDPTRYLLHRGHLLTTPDFKGGPMRSLLYWWLFSTMSRDWWIRFLEKYGSPFLVGKYDQNDDASRSILQSAFAWATRVGGLVVSSDTQIELISAAAGDTGNAYAAFMDFANREKSKLILGQINSAAPQPGGLNSGNAAQSEAVRDDLRQFDALALEASLQHGLFRQILLANGLTGNVTLTWGAEQSESLATRAAAIASLSTAGLRVAQPSLAKLSTDFGYEFEYAPGPVSPPTNLPFSAYSTRRLPAADFQTSPPLSDFESAVFLAAASADPFQSLTARRRQAPYSQKGSA